MELPVNCSKTDRKEPRCLSKGSFSPHCTTFYIYFFLTSIDTKFFITSRELIIITFLLSFTGTVKVQARRQRES